MKKSKPLVKFFLNKGAIFFLAVLAFVILVVYSYTAYQCSKMNMEITASQNSSQGDPVEFKEKTLKKYNEMQTTSEIALVVFSVAASALLSSILIEKRNSNKIVEQVFVDDFFTSDKFLGMLDSDKQKKILLELERQCNFDGCREKSEMYMAVREKLSKPTVDAKNLYYEKYYLDIVCRITEHYIEKTIIKSVELKPLGKATNEKEYIFLAVSSKKVEGYTPVEIKQVKIDNKIIDKPLIKMRKKQSKNTLDEKRGYSETTEFYVDKTLNFGNKKAVSLEVQYTTRCPVNDLVYTCRMPYPCKKFDFNFVVENDDYAINPSAFGFIDDAKNSPNRKDDRKRVSIKFDDWIFPLDGVCVYLEKSVAK